MIISLEEVISTTNITEDGNGRKVFGDVYTTQEILVNTDNIVSVRPVEQSFWTRIAESKTVGFGTKQFSAVFLNKGGVNSTDIVVVGSPNEIMSKLNKRMLLND